MRLLLVEDEKKLALSLKKALESESFAVDTAYDGEDALDKATFEPYDLIVLDIGLPKINGFEVTKKLREEKVPTPILMLTAKDTISDKVKGLNMGADDYLPKPFDFDELLARIRALSRRGKDEPKIRLSVDNLSLDPVTHVATRTNKELKLTAKEYALLEYLMRNQNHILSKTQILEHVWDIETDPFTNVVDVYIGYLRNKVDKDFPKEIPLIETVKGIGYRISNKK
ncbi:DNA-binding response regulator [Candidatus Woesebacteria bacterium RIFCSPLOWO2_01_FULL_39_23]|uniref:DNA-binding response regulator n=1 Tax=Candidatus Woesebacteria bacterium RIFCSPHIGHO2_01_FULL_40_22 TaxID=1802499 RepID=A0A1F7YJ35_9BACT|nr:MAG: DNA-binding response regulator [Candidatus Woesebacteria bacterium RBG_16_40_11]OGM26899.1 MAG: DNA-binding response regulator [Candidatus Woesebacteria bacterium RIFCSPHIGHO2_01_FULL_40_22]OGM63174.1 MAG: DNA-binding response regulator [Candidatus Woesebacteria bacterium RIFCSPLOWO2_01_FULL_39_23]